jgi:hypothetical protein
VPRRIRIACGKTTAVLLRLHYVRIQREALGFSRHDELDAHYSVPSRRP